MKILHTVLYQPRGIYSPAVHHSACCSLCGCIGNRTRSLGLTPVDWTSHPAEAEDLLTRKYTLFVIYLVDAGVCVDVSGIEPEALELTPVDWTSHPAGAEDFPTREYTPIKHN